MRTFKNPVVFSMILLFIHCESSEYPTVGGKMMGLDGTVVLQNQGMDDLTVSKNGNFTFASEIGFNASYKVTIKKQPLGQTCVVSNGQGIAEKAVTDILVDCISNGGATSLVASISTLALSMNCQPASSCTATQNAALTGNPRTITITNVGSNPASDISVSHAGFAVGTFVSSNTCVGVLPAGSSCVITITPGSFATEGNSVDCTNGTFPPTPGSVSIEGANTNSLSVDLIVLGYGCFYQGGFIYAVDDTTSATGSIGGKVISVTDQASPRIASGPQASSLVWSSDGGSNSSEDPIFGISEVSTSSSPDPSSGQVTGQVACDGATDGACNTNNIYDYYQNNAVGAPIDLSLYATGLCKLTIASYNDWYLPAICEMGTDGICPTTQNILSNLAFLIGDPNAGIPSTSCAGPLGVDCLAGDYWSSTEWAYAPDIGAWPYTFNTSGSSASVYAKPELVGARCTRSLTF